MDYTDFQVRRCPPIAYYIPNFITSEEEQIILDKITRVAKPRWTQLKNRRLINYGGVPHPNGMIAEEMPDWLQNCVDKINNLGIFESQKANHVLVNEYLPGQGIMPHTDGPLFYSTISTISCGSHTVLEFVDREKCALDQATAVPEITTNSNINEGEVKVSPPPDVEEDDVSNKREARFKLLLEPRSLLILKEDLYHNYLHSISELREDILCDRIYNYENCENVYKMGDCLERGTRISLTIRNVPKTSKMKLKFH